MNMELSQALLAIGRAAIHARLGGDSAGEKPAPLPPFSALPELKQSRACFVSLHRRDNHQLRGCIGCLEARQSLAECVAEHAVACAFADHRFMPLSAAEAVDMQLEISVLSPLESVAAGSPEQLLAALTPQEHGLVLSQGARRATFLPQVWQSLPSGDVFLAALLRKGGWPGWPGDTTGLEAWRYSVSQCSGPLVERAAP